MTSEAPLHGLLLTRDLFFSSKVTGTAQALGLRVEATASPDDVAQRLEQPPARLLFIDLDFGPLDLPSLLGRIARRGEVKVVAFGPHVEAGRLQEARDAGCDLVMPRSRFSAELVQILQS